MTQSPASLLDLDRYPILELDSDKGRELIAKCRSSLDDAALCLLPGFLTAEATRGFTKEATDLVPRAIRQDKLRTSYGWMDNSSFTPDHPRGKVYHTRNSTVPLHLIPENSPMRQLFFWDELTEFVRRCLGFETLYCSACPYLALEMKVYDSGDDICWHYDTNDGVVSLLLQQPDEGGGFEYAPFIRSEEDENYDEVGRVIDGTSEIVRRPQFEPGSLVLFRGRRSMHRVAPVGQTTKPRLIMLFSYDKQPNMVFPEPTVRAVLDPNCSEHRGTPSNSKETPVRVDT